MMMKHFGMRLVAMAVASALCASVTLAYGIPNIRYKAIASNEPVVMTVNGDPVHEDEYKAYLKYNKSYMEGMLALYGLDPASLWSDPESGAMFTEQLFEMADQQAAYLRVVNSEFEKQGLSLTREERENAYQTKRDSINSIGGEAMFEQWLAQNGFTERIYDNTVAASAYLTALYDAYYGEAGTILPLADQMDKFNADYLCAKHILVKSVDEMGAPLTGDALAQAQAKAEEALAAAQAGEDFDALIAKYNEDSGMAFYPDGYVFTEGEMVDAFYEGTLALQPGEISPALVESEYGWHIIQRQPLTAEQLEANAEIRDGIIVELTGKTFNDQMDELMAAAEIAHTEHYGEATYDNLQAIIGETDGADAAEDAPAEDAPAEDAPAAE